MKEKNKKKSRHKKADDLQISKPAIRNLKNGLGIFIALFAFLLYAQSISYDYTLDDTSVIKNNSIIKKGFAGIPTIVTTDYLSGTGDEERGPQYRPASLIMFAVEWQLFPDNPHVGHFMNVFLYALTCWILFLVMCKLLENYNLIFPFVCTLLFTAHPIHTEVINSIKSRDEILCFLFALASVYLTLKSIDKKSFLLAALSAICYFIAFSSKETAVSFIVIIPLMLFVFTKAETKWIMTISSMMVIAGAIYFLIRSRVLASLPEFSAFNFVMNNSINATSDLLSQKATAFFILLKYILLLIVPYSLSYDYSFAQIPIYKIVDPAAILAITIYLALGLYAVLKIRKKEIIAFAILFYLLALAPVSNIFLLIGSSMAERFLYMSSLGYCMALAFLLLKLTKTEMVKSKFSGIKQFIFGHSVFLFVFILAGAYSIRIFSRNPDWKDNVSLFGRDVEKSDKSARAHFNWGNEILNSLSPEEKNREKQILLIDQSIKELNKAASIYPDYNDAYLGLTNAYMMKGDFVNAMNCNKKAEELYQRPNAKVFYNFSQLYDMAGQLEKSLAYADSSIQYSPQVSFIYNQKGVVLSKLRRYEEAIQSFQQCIDRDPEFVMSIKNIGICYLNLNNADSALFYFNKAMAMDPMDPAYSKLIESAQQLQRNKLP